MFLGFCTTTIREHSLPEHIFKGQIGNSSQKKSRWNDLVSQMPKEALQVREGLTQLRPCVAIWAATIFDSSRTGPLHVFGPSLGFLRKCALTSRLPRHAELCRSETQGVH